MQIKTGYFFLADISGYTRFLTSSELDHATEILDALFDSILNNIEVPITIVKAEGDAIFCYIEESRLVYTQALIEAMEHTYFNFRRRLELMFLNSNCTCNACVNMKELDLKLFLHHGEYLVQEIGGKTDLQGAQVILIHRLTKNHVREKTGCRGYGLFTEAAIAAIGIHGLTRNMIEHIEEYEHYGKVRVFVHDLGTAWKSERERERKFVTPEESMAGAQVDLPIPPSLAWPYVMDSRYVRRYFSLESHERVDEAIDGRIGIGTAYHCQHEISDIDVLIIDLEAPYYVTARLKSIKFGLVYLYTIRLIPTADGCTFQILYDMRGEQITPDIVDAYQTAATSTVSIFARIIDQEIAEGKINQAAIVEISAMRAEFLRPVAADSRFANLK